MERGEFKDKINQDQFFDMINFDELSWQSIIYDLIKTEQLDPWDIDIGVLADRYVQVISELEDADFFISSKILLACSILLRLKTEILAYRYIQSLDDELYGKKEGEVKREIERIELDEGELPILSPRTPLARAKKVTLNELIGALNKAIDTESRRIKRHIRSKQAEKLILTVMPKSTHVPLNVRIKNIFGVFKNHMDSGKGSLLFSQFAREREEKLAFFVPVLHLSNEGKVHLYQEKHFDEIHLRNKIHQEDLKALEEELGRYEEGEEIEILESDVGDELT